MKLRRTEKWIRNKFESISYLWSSSAWPGFLQVAITFEDRLAKIRTNDNPRPRLAPWTSVTGFVIFSHNLKFYFSLFWSFRSVYFLFLLCYERWPRWATYATCGNYPKINSKPRIAKSRYIISSVLILNFVNIFCM